MLDEFFGVCGGGQGQKRQVLRGVKEGRSELWDS